MARVPQVTRTVKTTTATVMCLDTENEATFKQDITLSRTYKDEAAILKVARKKLETEKVKVVHVVKSEVKRTLYGMTEAEFIGVAKELPPRSKKETV